jgi:uncharacterized membrane protein
MKLKNAALFVTSAVTALVTGRAFWAWLGENPAHFPGAAFVEFYQVLNRMITFPIAMMGGTGIVLAGISAFLFRRDRPVFICLLASAALSLLAAIITIIVHLPINEQLASWDPSALAPSYREALERWRAWNAVRLIVLFAAMSAAFGAMLLSGSNHEEKPNA